MLSGAESQARESSSGLANRNVCASCISAVQDFFWRWQSAHAGDNCFPTVGPG